MNVNNFKIRIDSATTEDEIDALCRLWLVRNKPVIEISVKDAAQQLFELLKIRIEDASLTITADGWLLSLYPPAHRYDVGLIPERWFEKRIIIEKIDYPTACKYPLTGPGGELHGHRSRDKALVKCTRCRNSHAEADRTASWSAGAP